MNGKYRLELEEKYKGKISVNPNLNRQLVSFQANNNSNIVRMVKNYFFEMCLVIFEMFRVIKKDGIVYMVNDNVRYAGETIPVDLILSDFAEAAGFNVDKIWILGNGKGNSSQQMGNHGREELRKCLYVWRK